jgi:hypothetical protein
LIIQSEIGPFFLVLFEKIQKMTSRRESPLRNSQTASFYSNEAEFEDYSNSEYYNTMAKRIMHGSHFKIFYLCIAILSFLCLITSLVYTCPPSWFYILEFIIIIGMTIETTIRIVGVGKPYWKSVYNVFDLSMVAICLIIFLLLLGNQCGSTQSAIVEFEEILLIIRNVIQLVRLGVLVQRNRKRVETRVIDFDLPSGQYENIMNDFNIPMLNVAEDTV